MQRRHRRWHRRIWLVLGIALPAIVAAAVVLRPAMHEQAAVRIAPPLSGS